MNSFSIYFAGSIRGGRDDRELYARIVEHLKQYGEVLTEHIAGINLMDSGEEMSDEAITDRDLDWLRKSDVIVAEVSTPSLGVGYEIGMAEMLGKRILCLYREGSSNRLSALIGGSRTLEVLRYQKEEEVLKGIDRFFSRED